MTKIAKESVRKTRFLDTWRIGETECWLTDMAAEGLHLSDMFGARASFKRGEPAAVRYRMDFGEKDASHKQHDELIAFYAESGWEYVCSTSNGTRIFRSPEERDAPEIHTDPAEQAYTLRRLEKQLTKSAILICALLAFSLIMMSVGVFIGDTPALSFITGSGSNAPLLVVLNTFVIITATMNAFSIRRLVQTLREGRPINHRAPWQPHKRGYHLLLAFVITLGLAANIGPILHLVNNHVYGDALTAKAEANPHIPRLSGIETSPALITEPRWDADWSIYATRQAELYDYGQIPGETWPDSVLTYSPSLRVRYIELTLPFLGRGVLHDLTKNIEEWNEMHEEFYPLVEITIPGADYALMRDSRSFDEVFVQKGNTVLHMQYAGTAGIDAVVQAAAALLAAW